MRRDESNLNLHETINQIRNHDTVINISHVDRVVGVLTLSDPDSEDTEEDEECCWGLEMDMGESALCGDTESLCCSSDPTPVLTTQGTCSDTSGFGGETTKQTRS